MLFPEVDRCREGHGAQWPGTDSLDCPHLLTRVSKSTWESHWYRCESTVLWYFEGLWLTHPGIKPHQDCEPQLSSILYFQHSVCPPGTVVIFCAYRCAQMSQRGITPFPLETAGMKSLHEFCIFRLLPFGSHLLPGNQAGDVICHMLLNLELVQKLSLPRRYFIQLLGIAD